MSELETSVVNGFTVGIYQDQDCPSPREDCHGCELALSHRRYDLPNDEGIDPDNFGGSLDAIETYLRGRTDERGALVILPVWGYDHSGLSMKAGERTYPFGDQWDSGCLGLAYVTRQNWADTQGTEWTGSDEQVTQAELLIGSDVEEYSRWLNGECYGYTVTDFDGEEVGACWGYIGYEFAGQCAREAAESLTHEVKCTGSLSRLTGKVDHDGPCPIHNLTPEEDS